MLRDLFHPDYDRRLWHLTRSADPAGSGETAGARGLLQSMQGIAADTAGGELHPALRTLLCGEPGGTARRSHSSDALAALLAKGSLWRQPGRQPEHSIKTALIAQQPIASSSH